MKFGKRLVAILLMLSLCMGFASCSAQPEATAPEVAVPDATTKAEEPVVAAEPTQTEPPPSGTVMLYSSMQEDQLIAIKQAFEAKYPGVTLEYYFAGTSKVITKIATEAQAGHVDADIIWVGDPVDYVSFKEEGILQPYTSPEAAAINPTFIDKDGYYTGARMMNMGIGYNTTMVTAEEAPKSWNDLLDSKWNDQIVMTDPGSSGTSKYWMNALMSSAGYGEAFFQSLKDNGCYLESGTTACHNQLAAGAYKVGVCLDYVTANLANEGSTIAFVFPEDTVSIFSPIGLVKDCANERNGKLLYDFILSKEGQLVLIANNLISVRNDLEQPSVDVAAISENALDCDLDIIAKNAEKYIETFDKIFGL